MKRINLVLLLSLFVVILQSCKNDDLFKGEDFVELGKYELTVDEAKQLLFDFVKKDLKTRGNQDIEIGVAKKHNYQIKYGQDTKSDVAIDEDIPVYEFSLKNGRDIGFALILSDKRIQNVLAYSPNGSLNDTVFNLGLKYFVRAIPDHIKYSLDNSSSKFENITKSDDEENIVYHYCEIPVKWGQAYPFNANVPILCPNASPQYHGKAPAGCVAIAVAQVMAYHAQPSSFNWNLLLGSTYIGENAPNNVCIEAAKLAADIGVKVDMLYDCDGSGSYIANARVALGRYGYRSDPVYNYNTQWILSSIDNDWPVLLGGDDGYVGHLWVVDARRSSTINGVPQNWLQMNWGWYGSCDGWFYCYEPPVFDTGSYEFNRNLKYVGNIEYWN